MTEAEQIHHRKRANERDRNSDGGNERGSPVAQKDEDDKNYQDDREDQRALYIVDRGADGRGAVQHDGGLDPLRNGRFDRRQLCSYPIDGIDNVGAGLAENNYGDGRHAVQIASRANVLR